MEQRPFDQILFAAVITVVIVVGFFVVNPGGASRDLLEKAGLWGTFYENYLPELPAESGIAGQILDEIVVAIPDRWDRLISGLDEENQRLQEKVNQFEAAGSSRSGDVRALERRIQENEKKIAEYRVLQAKDKAVSPSSR